MDQGRRLTLARDKSRPSMKVVSRKRARWGIYRERQQGRDHGAPVATILLSQED